MTVMREWREWLNPKDILKYKIRISIWYGDALQCILYSKYCPCF